MLNIIFYFFYICWFFLLHFNGRSEMAMLKRYNFIECKKKNRVQLYYKSIKSQALDSVYSKLRILKNIDSYNLID